MALGDFEFAVLRTPQHWTPDSASSSRRTRLDHRTAIDSPSIPHIADDFTIGREHVISDPTRIRTRARGELFDGSLTDYLRVCVATCDSRTETRVSSCATRFSI